MPIKYQCVFLVTSAIEGRLRNVWEMRRPRDVGRLRDATVPTGMINSWPGPHFGHMAVSTIFESCKKDVAGIRPRRVLVTYCMKPTSASRYANSLKEQLVLDLRSGGEFQTTYAVLSDMGRP
ncbi:hypothetical protein O1611_g7037 [Lasiodiplodia mahajangana]|uniref:Uncharacterized protein n=1 Tax=Lasiodiplodia mahajangana TaxID=1108764 RepID=A0ACC2JGV9_9PEZI|nr:hypothetical protein O1611_g7037 [Lasiodiplodia mahajangana]